MQTLAPVPVSFYPPLRFTSRFSTERFFFLPQQDVARYWFSSAPDAFTGCRTNPNHEWNKDVTVKLLHKRITPPHNLELKGFKSDIDDNCVLSA